MSRSHDPLPKPISHRAAREAIYASYHNLAAAVVVQARQDIAAAGRYLQDHYPINEADERLTHARIGWRWLTDPEWPSRIPFSEICDAMNVDREIAVRAVRAQTPAWVVRHLERPIVFKTLRPADRALDPEEIEPAPVDTGPDPTDGGKSAA